MSESAPPGRGGLWGRLRAGLAKTRIAFAQRLSFGAGKAAAEIIADLEVALISADVGVATTMELLDGLHRDGLDRAGDGAAVLAALRTRVEELLGDEQPALNIVSGRLNVILVVGVNGTGKTTSVARLAHRLQQENYSVLLAAADTFRAAAIEQLEIWGRRLGVDVIRQQSGADPAAVAFDAVQAGRARGVDVVVVDTAGRLHTQTNLMAELAKIRRVLGKAADGAPHEILLTLDANTGQNALVQARMFHEALGVTGIILTKLDSTAKGGVVLAIKRELDLPVKLVGLGEGLTDMIPFTPAAFADALFAGADNGVAGEPADDAADPDNDRAPHR